MADFSDVMVFAQTHGSCGGVTPAVSPSAAGGYRLILTCACGATLERRVNADEAAQAPFANAAAPAPRRPDRPRVTPSPELERAMQEALAAEEAAPSVTSAPPRETPPIAPRPERAAAQAPSVELEDVLRQAVAASDAEASPARSAPPKRGVPRMSNVQGTVRAALREQERLRADVAAEPAPVRPKSRALWLIAAALLVLAAVTAFLYVASELELEAPTLTHATPDSQKRPVTFPAASTSMPSAPGTFGSPGIVSTSPA